MKRWQRLRTDVFGDVNCAPFPSGEDLTIGFGDVARAGGNSPRGRATSRLSEFDWKS
jgi:hypothetical protein